MVCIFLVNAATTMKYAHGSTFLLSRFHLLDLFRGNLLQFYRLFTFSVYFGTPDIDNFLHIMFFYRYSCMLEESCMYLSEYIWVLVWVQLSLLVSSMFVISAMGPALACVITFLWTRKNPRALVQAYGFVTFNAFYIPFILPLFTLIHSQTISLEELLGIVCGQLIYFFKDCYSKIGRNILKTPCWLHKLCKESHSCCDEKRKKEKEGDEENKTAVNDEKEMKRVQQMIRNNLRKSKEEAMRQLNKDADDYDSDDYTDKTLTPRTTELYIPKENKGEVNKRDERTENKKDERTQGFKQEQIKEEDLPETEEIDKLSEELIGMKKESTLVSENNNEDVKENNNENVKENNNENVFKSTVESLEQTDLKEQEKLKEQTSEEKESGFSTESGSLSHQEVKKSNNEESSDGSFHEINADDVVQPKSNNFHNLTNNLNNSVSAMFGKLDSEKVKSALNSVSSLASKMNSFINSEQEDVANNYKDKCEDLNESEHNLNEHVNNNENNIGVENNKDDKTADAERDSIFNDSWDEQDIDEEQEEKKEINYIGKGNTFLTSEETEQTKKESDTESESVEWGSG